MTSESLRATASILGARARSFGITALAAIPRGANAIDVTIPDEAPGDLLSQISAPGRLVLVPYAPVAGTPTPSFDAALRAAQRAGGLSVTGGGAAAVPEGFIVARDDTVSRGSVRSGYVALRRAVPVTGGAIAGAWDESSMTDPILTIEFTAGGAGEFTALTRRVAANGRASGRPEAFAIVLDGRVVVRPTVDYSQYPDGITGSSTTQVPLPEDLDPSGVAAILNSGPLPLELAPRGVAPASP